MNVNYESLINELISDGYLKTSSIIEAFKKIDRADFVLDEYKEKAYVNEPLPIGFGQTISQPLTVSFMLELLQPREGEKILEIGAGSGWQTAIIAGIINSVQTGGVIPDASIGKNPNLEMQNQNQEQNIAGQISGKVIAVERILELKELAKKNISKYGFIDKKIVEVILGDGSKGYKNEAPYDRIIAAAAVSGEIPIAWKRQLKIGGKIVAPVENSIVVIDKISKNKYVKKDYFGFSFVPLISNT